MVIELLVENLQKVDRKARNPELLVFSPALLESPFGQKRLAAMQRENRRLFLLTESGKAHLGDGRKIRWEEIKRL